jgi:drug/metabolite transporter (DMT)-like permease
MTQPSHPGRAAVWMLGAILSFSAMAVAGRAVSFELDTFEIMMYRSFIGVVIVVSTAGALGKLGDITRHRLPLHFVRNLSHFTGQNLWFFAITMAPLAQVFALEFTSPIWVTLFAPLVLAEKLTRVRMVAALLGFIGILFVARPGAGELSPGVIAAAASALGFAGSILFTKLLTRTETITCILFWLTAMQAIFGILAAGYDGDIALPSSATLPWLVLIGCAGLLAHLCLTNALSVAPATVVVPMDFVRLPAIAVVGMLFYNEPIDLFVIFGALVIFGANYINIWFETRRVTVL